MSKALTGLKNLLKYKEENIRTCPYYVQLAMLATYRYRKKLA